MNKVHYSSKSNEWCTPKNVFLNLDEEFDFILSDIEMPNLDGFGLARGVRSKGIGLPMIALTTRLKQRDIDEGIDAGFNLYLEKLNEEELLKGIDKVLKGA